MPLEQQRSKDNKPEGNKSGINRLDVRNAGQTNDKGDERLDVQNAGQPSGKPWNVIQNAELGNPQPSAGGNKMLELLSSASCHMFSGWSNDSTARKETTPRAQVEKRSKGDQTGSRSTLLDYASKLNPRKFIQLCAALSVLSLVEGVHGQAVPGNAVNSREGFSVSPTATPRDKTSLGEAFTKEFPELAQVLKKPQPLETGTMPYDNAVHSEKLQGDKTLLQERSIANMDNLLGRQQATPTETVTITVTETATETATVHAEQSDIDNANKAGFTLGAVATGFVPTFTVMSFAFVLSNLLWYKRYNRLHRRDRAIEFD